VGGEDFHDFVEGCYFSPQNFLYESSVASDSSKLSELCGVGFGAVGVGDEEGFEGVEAACVAAFVFDSAG
jgi:hypothetical protein